MALTAGDLRVAGLTHLVNLNKQRPAVARSFQSPILVTAHAILVCHSLVIKYFPDFVGLVTIDAGRQRVRFLFPQFPLYDLAVHRLYLSMAFGAGCSNVLPGNRRTGVCMRKNGMGRMARCAIGSDDKPFLQQSLSVNTFGKILEDMVLVDDAKARNRRSFLMAFPAQERNLER